MHLTRPKTDVKRKIPFAYLAARFLSDAVNPLFIPPTVFLLLGWIGHISIAESGWVAGLSILFYSLLPMGIAFYLLHHGYITSLDLPVRKNRSRLFFYSICSSSAGSLLLVFYFYATHPFFAMTALVFLLNPIAGFLINLKWKISIHAAALASAGAIFLSLSLLPVQFYKTSADVLSLSILLVLLPLMIWARRYLRIHSFPELIGGAVAGIIFTLVEISIMLRIW